MFKFISYEKFRDTKDVSFFDITIENSNYRDLVIHTGPAISPPNANISGKWQFYLHKNQEDNLLSISGGRTFYLINFDWQHPFYKIRLESVGMILRIPKNTFHRSVSDESGSIVLNQAKRNNKGTIKSEFKIINSGDNQKLFNCLRNIKPKFYTTKL